MAGTDDDHTGNRPDYKSPEAATEFAQRLKQLKVSADFVQKTRVPPELAQQLNQIARLNRGPPTPEERQVIDAIRQKEKERDAIKKTLDAIDEEILTYRLWLEAHGIKLPDSSALTVTTPKQVVAPPTQTTSATPVGGSQQNDVPPVIEPVTEQKSGEKQEEASAAALSAPAGPAQREIAEATRKLWPPNGIVPLDLGATALWEAIGKLNSDEAAAKSKTSGKKEISHDPPSVDSCTRFLEKQRGQAKRN